MNVPRIRLTSLAHGGGCGCKLAPSVLQQLLVDHPAVNPYRQLLVGIETGDDAAVWQLDDSTCVIATTDFFMPVVDDPFDFGRIAATNPSWPSPYSGCQWTRFRPKPCARSSRAATQSARRQVYRWRAGTRSIVR